MGQKLIFVLYNHFEQEVAFCFVIIVDNWQTQKAFQLPNRQLLQECSKTILQDTFFRGVFLNFTMSQYPIWWSNFHEFYPWAPPKLYAEMSKGALWFRRNSEEVVGEEAVTG